MITLVAKDEGRVLGIIEEDDLELLRNQLEEEDSEDTDYYVSGDTIAILKDAGARADLLRILREAIGDKEGVEIALIRE